MKLFKTIDCKISDFGYKKIKDDGFGFSFEKYNEDYKYTHVIDFVHKASGEHILQSYDKESTTKDGSVCVGLDYRLLKLILKKINRAMK